jgi:hypothetical protein
MPQDLVVLEVVSLPQEATKFKQLYVVSGKARLSVALIDLS